MRSALVQAFRLAAVQAVLGRQVDLGHDRVRHRPDTVLGRQLKMRRYEPGLRYCGREGCGKSFRPGFWEDHRAQTDGWFMQRNGIVWCPDHNPDWVAEWRKKRKRT